MIKYLHSKYLYSTFELSEATKLTDKTKITMATLTQINTIKSNINKMTLPANYRLFLDTFVENLGDKKKSNKALEGYLLVEEYKEISKSFFSYDWEKDSDEFCFDRLEAFIQGYFKNKPKVDNSKFLTDRVVYRGEFNQLESIPSAFELK